jgi:hypothetical protein
MAIDVEETYPSDGDAVQTGRMQSRKNAIN